MSNETKSTEQSHAIVVASPAPIEPATFTELRALAKDAADSRFFGAENPAQAMLIMMAGRDLGFSYTQSLRVFHVIKGKPSLSADGMVAVCLAHPDLCEFFRPVESTETSATWETSRVGDVEKVRRHTFTIEDAKRAELLGNTMWKKYPRRMLNARAKSELARDIYPELLAGLYEPDEVENFEPRRSDVQITPAPKSDPHVASAALAKSYAAEITAVTTIDALEDIGTRIASDKKARKLANGDLDLVRAAYGAKEKMLKPETPTPAEAVS